jgi:hypothetical protein
LDAEINAISAPEKNAESSSERRMKKKTIGLNLKYDYWR